MGSRSRHKDTHTVSLVGLRRGRVRPWSRDGLDERQRSSQSCRDTLSSMGSVWTSFLKDREGTAVQMIRPTVSHKE